jgi:uncharacterized membrane protein YgcG
VNQNNLVYDSELEEEQKPIDQERTAKLKAAMYQFVLVMKNLALFPDTNKTNVDALTNLHHWFNEYLQEHSSLVFEVTKDQLLADDGSVIYQEKPTDQILSGPLFRDGIQAISFEYGLTFSELKTFLTILLRFRNQDTDEEDLVANLWEASLTNIRYIISSEYEQVDPNFEISALKVARPGAPRDVDAPWQDEALGPMATQGSTPLSKPIASLFALAESNSFLSSTSDGHGGGSTLPGSEGSGANQSKGGGGSGGGSGLGSGDDEQTNYRTDFSGSQDDSDDDSPGFDPLNDRSTRYSSDNMPNLDDSFSTLAAAKKAENSSSSGSKGAGSGGNQASSDGSASDQPTPQGENDDSDLDIDMSSVAEAFKDMESFDKMPSAPKPEAPQLSLDFLKDRPEAEGPQLSERLRYWGLSGREVKQISALIKWDESRNFSFDSLKIVNILLKSDLINENILKLVNQFINNEIKTSLKRVELKYFNNFYKEFKDQNPGNQLEAMLLKEIQIRMNSSELLGALVEPGPTEEAVANGFEDLRYFLYQLSPIGIQTLTTILPKTANQQLWRLIIELVAYDLLNSSPNRSNDVISRLPDRALVYLLRLIQANIKILQPQVINSLTRHKSAAVRETVARVILEYDQDNFHAVCAHMVMDPDPTVQRLVRPALSQRRNSMVESYLFNFLRNSYTNERHEADRNLLDCYQLYGKCATSSALPFLEEVLLKKDFKTFLSRATEPHKVGAALALLLMPRESGAGDILNKASKSSFRNVRQSYLEAQRILSSNSTSFY